MRRRPTPCSTLLGPIALAAVAGVLLLTAQGHARGESDPPTIEGTGTFQSFVARTAQPLQPPCVSLALRTGRVAFTGLISNALEDGAIESHALRDACTSAVAGTSRQTYDLRNAVVAGRTGRVLVEADGYFEGDATTPPGARIRYQLKVRGIGGELRGLEGEGQSVGFESAFAGEQAGSTNTYHLTIRFTR